MRRWKWKTAPCLRFYNFLLITALTNDFIPLRRKVSLKVTLLIFIEIKLIHLRYIIDGIFHIACLEIIANKIALKIVKCFYLDERKLKFYQTYCEYWKHQPENSSKENIYGMVSIVWYSTHSAKHYVTEQNAL